MKYKEFIQYYYPKVSLWNRLAGAEFNAKNEFKMLAEEYLEYKIAVEEDEKPEIVDAIIDELFIILGTAYKIDFSKEWLYEYIGEAFPSISVIKKIKDGSYKSTYKNEEGLTRWFITKDFQCCLASYVYFLYSTLQKKCNNNDDCIKELIDAVYDANMTKIQSEGSVVFTEKSGHKVEKPKDFTPPDIEKILKNHNII